ncbi:hypothetical protein BDZ89DRAFT_1041303 [Hymenopellis radicata]|nr:hypothetical protein BDZ89DRAFT_1041303 [Hymenopellis radicata]
MFIINFPPALGVSKAKWKAITARRGFMVDSQTGYITDQYNRLWQYPTLLLRGHIDNKARGRKISFESRCQRDGRPISNFQQSSSAVVCMHESQRRDPQVHKFAVRQALAVGLPPPPSIESDCPEARLAGLTPKQRYKVPNREKLQDAARPLGAKALQRERAREKQRGYEANYWACNDDRAWTTRRSTAREAQYTIQLVKLGLWPDAVHKPILNLNAAQRDALVTGLKNKDCQFECMSRAGLLKEARAKVEANKKQRRSTPTLFYKKHAKDQENNDSSENTPNRARTSASADASAAKRAKQARDSSGSEEAEGAEVGQDD